MKAYELADEYKDRECWTDIDYQQWCEEAEDTLRQQADENYELKAIMYTAIKAGDWKVDGACDPDSLLYGFQLRDELC